MKELSIEEKAKAYDEAIHRASGFRTQEYKDVAEYIFPELAESEDERTWLINYLSNRELNSSIIAEKENLKKAIAWLQRQDEQKPAYTKEYDFHGIKFIPKFAKGDIIKDKKCGEVSTIEDFSYDTGLYTHTYGQFSITIQDNYEIIAQKPAWSEEDEKMIDLLIAIFRVSYPDEVYKANPIDTIDMKSVSSSEIIDWLKSLKDRVQPQPKQEWSEEDCNQIEIIACHLDNIGNRAMAESLLNIMDKYKSYRPQPQWKPSDVQMEALANALSLAKNCGEESAFELRTLYEQLKKLMEE